MRVMGKVGLVLAGIVIANILTLHGAPLYADLIPSTPGTTPVGAAGNADRDAVQLQLAQMGLSSADIAARLDSLDAADVAVLADNPQQVQMAGTSPLVAVVGGLLALILLVVILDSTSQAEEPEPITPNM